MGLDVNALNNNIGLQSNIRINPYQLRYDYSTRPDFRIKPDVIVKNSEIKNYIKSKY